jgi:hypothetical protein
MFLLTYNFFLRNFKSCINFEAIQNKIGCITIGDLKKIQLSFISENNHINNK